MGLTENQKVVLRFLNTRESATLEECYKASNQGYFLNWNKHMGVFMSRLIKRGLVERVKKGVFKIKNKNKVDWSNDQHISIGLFSETNINKEDEKN